MTSIVLYGDRKKYNCSVCMDGSNWIAQGRSKEHAADRIKRKLTSKGCIKDARREVIRISIHDQGHKIYRCPKALSDEIGAVSLYSDYLSIRDGNIRFHPSEKPFKWHKAQEAIRSEIAKVEKSRAENQTTNPPPPVKRRR